MNAPSAPQPAELEPVTPAARRWLALILLLGLAARAGWALRLGDAPRYPDAGQYLMMSENLRAGRGPIIDDHLKAWRAPALPVLLAALESSGLPRLGLRLALAALASLLPLLLFALARELALGERVALLAAAAAALWPHQIYFSGLILTEGLVSVALAAASWVVVRARRLERLDLALAAGALLALTTLSRFPFGLYPVWVMALVALTPPRPRRWKPLLAVLLAGYVLAMAPWWIRNARLFGHFVPHSTHLGHHLWETLGPHATGGPCCDTIPYPIDYPAPGFSEVEWDRGLQKLAWANVRRDPGVVPRLALIKLPRLWSPIPNDPDHRTTLLVTVSLLSVGPMLLLAPLGLWRHRQRLWELWPLWAPALYLTLLHSTISYGSVRYRLPAEPLLLVACALAFAKPSRG